MTERYHQMRLLIMEKSVGILTSHMDDYGIALLNINETENCINQTQNLKSNEALLNPFNPNWVIDSI